MNAVRKQQSLAREHTNEHHYAHASKQARINRNDVVASERGEAIIREQVQFTQYHPIQST